MGKRTRELDWITKLRIISVLADMGGCASPKKIAERLSEITNRSFSVPKLLHHLNFLVEIGVLEKDGGTYFISEHTPLLCIDGTIIYRGFLDLFGVFLCPYRHSCPLPPEKRGFDFKNPERCPLGQELKRRGLLKYVKIS